MVTKKDLIIAVLSTFCLTATLFVIMPTRSASTQDNGLEYDPWEDVNGDGKIDILDIVNLSNSYGATGNPTKNVNVTNWPEALMPTKSRSWTKYVGQHDQFAGCVLVPQDLGDIGSQFVYFSPQAGVCNIDFTYHTLGEIDLQLPMGREFFGKITLYRSVDMAVQVQNLTLEIGYTNKANYVPLLSSSWATEGPGSNLPTSPQGYTLELGSLNSDVEIHNMYLYFRVHIKMWVPFGGYQWTYCARSANNDICILIPNY
jgi:hypothetical protein